MRILKLATILLVAFTVTSCDSNLLEVQNPNARTPETFWKSGDDARKGVSAVYSVIRLDGFWSRWLQAARDHRGDLARADSPWGELESQSEFTYTATSFTPEIIWKTGYHGIYRANQVLTNVPDIEMDEGEKSRLLAETKFLRAHIYFQLLKEFRRFPLITKPIPVDSIRLPKAERSDIRNLIVQDLQDAKANLPVTQADQGRATKGAASATLGKVYLYNEEWQNASEEFEELITSGEYNYELMPEHASNFTTENEFNQESVFEVDFAELGGSVIRPGNETEGTVDLTSQPDWKHTMTRSITYSAEGFGWADNFPTQALKEDFEEEQTVNGNDDPRMKSTLIYNNPDVNVYGDSYADVYGENNDTVYWAKYALNNRDIDREPEGSPMNIRVIRYADVLLMYAEAQNELNDQATAAQYIQQVRDRANMPDRESEFATLTQEEMRDRIAHERVVELAGESKRWHDIRRWGWPTEPDKVQMLRDRDPDFVGFQEGRTFLPIPLSELNTNPAIEQNPAY